MDLYRLKNKRLEQLEPEPFNLEKDIQSLIEENCNEIFNLRFVKTEFSIQNYRIDSLCFDEESKSFVIVEYKKNQSYSVIDQGFSYLSTMLDNRADFVLEFNESTGENLKREEVDWSQSRVIFVSPSFNTFQKGSVNFKDIPFELWEIKKYNNGLIGLNQISSKSKESIKTVKKTQQKVLSEVKVNEESSLLDKTNANIQQLYEDIKGVASGWDDFNFRVKTSYIAFFRGNKAKIFLNIQKSKIKIHLLRRVDYKGNVNSTPVKYEIDDPKSIFELKKYEYKEVYEYNMKNDNNFDYIMMVLKHKYMAR